MCYPAQGSPFIANAGTFRKSAGTATTLMIVRFNNSSTVVAQQGMIDFYGQYTCTAASNLRFILSSTSQGTGYAQMRFYNPLVPAGTLSGQLVSGFNPPAGASFQVIAGGLADVPLSLDRSAGNGYVFDFYMTGDTLTLVARPGYFALPPYLSLMTVRPGICSLLLEGQPGLTYRILSASAMGDTPPPAWTPLCTNTTASGLVSLLITNGLAPYQFYRAVTP